MFKPIAPWESSENNQTDQTDTQPTGGVFKPVAPWTQVQSADNDQTAANEPLPDPATSTPAIANGSHPGIEPIGIPESDKDLNYYLNYQSEDEAAQSKNSDALTGFDRGIQQSQAMGGGFVEAAGELIGNDVMANWGKQVREKNAAEAEQARARVGQFTDIRSISDGIDWLQGTVAETIPQMAPSAAGAAAGAMAGSPLGPLGAAAGGLLGAFLPSFVMGVGETQMEIKDRDGTAPGAAMVGGSLVGIMDAAVPGKIGSKLVKSFGKDAAEEMIDGALKKELKELAKSGIESGLVEGLTEMAQDSVVKMTAGAATNTEAGITAKGLLNSFAAGVAGGTAMDAGIGGAQLAGSKLKPKGDEYPALPQPESLYGDSDGNISDSLNADTDTLADTIGKKSKGDDVAPDDMLTESLSTDRKQATDALKERLGIKEASSDEESTSGVVSNDGSSSSDNEGNSGTIAVDGVDTVDLGEPDAAAGLSVEGSETVDLGEPSASGVVSDSSATGSQDSESATPDSTSETASVPDSLTEATTGQTEDLQSAGQPSGQDSAAVVVDEQTGKQTSTKEAIDVEAASVNTDPTDAQKEAGNYKKGHIKWQGRNISIENPRGSMRSGTDPDGKQWEQELPAHYGYIRGTTGSDGDPIDVFMADDITDDSPVFVVDQIDPKTGKFDEVKVLMGFATAADARDTYLAAYEKGWKGLGKLHKTTKHELTRWLDNGNQRGEFKPAQITTVPLEDYLANSENVADVQEHLRSRYGVDKKTSALLYRDLLKNGELVMQPDGNVRVAPAAHDELVMEFGAEAESTPSKKKQATPPQSDNGPADPGSDSAAADSAATESQTSKAEDKPKEVSLTPADLVEQARQAIESGLAPEHLGNTGKALDRDTKYPFPDIPKKQIEEFNEQLRDEIGSLPIEMDLKDFAEVTNEMSAMFDANTPRTLLSKRPEAKENLSVKEAQKRVDEWRRNASEQDKRINGDKVILSLFDLSGTWAKPYAEAGYQVYLFDIQSGQDINDFSVQYFADTYGDFEGNEVYGILAACPCTDFASSGARWFADKDKDGRTEASKELVFKTLQTIEYFRPKVWAVENPVGRISDLTGLPDPRLTFQPHHFGETYTKKTQLWGNFNPELPMANTEPTEGSKMHSKYGGKSIATKNARSETPEGFAYAFFNANNYIDSDKKEYMQWKYPEASGAIGKAMDAGVSDTDIDRVIREHYENYDYDKARAELAKLVKKELIQKRNADTSKRQADNFNKNTALNPTDTLRQGLAKAGGLDRESWKGQLSSTDYFKSKSGVFGRPLFPRQGGMTVDEAREYIAQREFMLPGVSGDLMQNLTANDALQIIEDMLQSGNDIYQIHHPDFGQLAQEQDQQRQIMGSDDIVDTEDFELDLTADELTGLSSLYKSDRDSVGVDLANFSRKAFVDQLNNKFARYFDDERWKQAFAPASVSNDDTAVYRAIEQIFGRKTTAVKATSPEFDIFNGVVFSSDSRNIFINEKSEVDHVRVAGHELLHTIRIDRPDLYDWYASNAQQHLKGLGQYRKLLNKRNPKDVPKVSLDKALEELLADISGDLFASPEFLQRLADDDPGKFSQLLKAVIKYFKQLQNKISSMPSLNAGRYVKDIEAVASMYQEVLKEFSKGNSVQTDTLMQSYSNQDILDSEKAQQRREKKQREAEARQNVEDPDDFVLTGSDREADQLAARGQESLFSLKKSNGTPHLVTLHNLTEANIRHSESLGGIPVPSLAVTTTDNEFQSFGGISLVANPDILNDPDAKTFNADIYSPRYPNTINDIDYDRLSAAIKAAGVEGTSASSLDQYIEKEDITQLKRSSEVVRAFLDTTSKRIKPIYKGAKAPKQFEKYYGMWMPDLIGESMRNESFRNDLIEQGKAELRESLKIRNRDLSETELSKLVDEEAAERLYTKDGDLNYHRGILAGLIRDIVNSRSTPEIDIDAMNSEAMQTFRASKPLQKKFDKWVAEKFSGVITGSKIVDGYTRSGNQRTRPHTLNNVVEMMTRRLQGGEDFNYGLGNVRSGMAKRFRDIPDIQSSRDQLTDSEGMKAVKEKNVAEFQSLAEELKDYYKYQTDRLGYMDAVGESFYEKASKGNHRVRLQDFSRVPKELMRRVERFLDSLKYAPTEYFESKVGRAVGFNEFAGAVVPTGTSKDVIDTLKQHGLKVVRYNRDTDNRTREKVIERNFPEAMFSRKMQNQGSRLPTRPVIEQKIQEGKEQLKRTKQRWLKSGGLLHDSTREAKIAKEGQQNHAELLIEKFVGKLDEASRLMNGGKNVAQLTENERIRLDNALRGATASTSGPMHTAITDMRNYIDLQSNKMIAALNELIDMKVADLNEKEFQELQQAMSIEGDTPETSDEMMVEAMPAKIQDLMRLTRVIGKNRGRYVHRSYRIFDDAGWVDKVMKDTKLVDRAAEIVKHGRAGVTHTQAVAEVEAMLIAQSKQNGMLNYIGNGSKLGAKDNTILKERVLFHPVIRQLMGEYRDPKVNFTRSTTMMGNWLANHEFLMRVRRESEELGLISRGVTPEHKHQIASQQSETMSPLNGWYTSEDFDQALTDAVEVFAPSTWESFILPVNAWVKAGKTVFSPTTQARNFLSATFFAIANGYGAGIPKYAGAARRMTVGLTTRRTGNAIRRALPGVKGGETFSTMNDRDFEEYAEMVRLGVLHDNPYANELKQSIEEAMSRDPLLMDRTSFKSWAQGGLFDLLKPWQLFYQNSDDFWKIIAFKQQVEVNQKNGMSVAEAKDHAAKRIRDTIPTYSQVPKLVQGFRRNIFVGSFVSFPAEIIRTTKNQITIGIDEFQNDREAFRRRAIGLTIAHGFFYGIWRLGMEAIGFDEEDDEAFRGLVAPWSRNANLLYTGIDQNGQPHYVDMSSLDPYSYLKKPFTAIMNGNNEGLAQKALDAGVEVLSSFLSYDILFNALAQAGMNVDSFGRGLRAENMDAADRVNATLDVLWDAVKPGVVNNVEGFIKAGQGVVSRSGKEYTLKNEAAALVGFRNTTVNFPSAMRNSVFDFNKQKRGASAPMRDLLRSNLTADRGDVVAALAKTQRMHGRAYKGIIKKVNAGKRLGIPDNELRSMLIDGGMTKKDAALVVKGVAPEWKPTDYFRDNTRKDATMRFKQHSDPERAREAALNWANKYRTMQQLRSQATQ